MKVYPQPTELSLTLQLEEKVKGMRQKKAFNPSQYIEFKSILLNRYMKEFNLSTCIIAISGGVDSATVLGLVVNASKMPNSPIKNIIPIMLPAYSSNGVTNQKFAGDQGEKVCEYLHIGARLFNVSVIAEKLKMFVDGIADIEGGKWAEGQLIPYLRTPILYYLTSLYSQNKEPAIICGTTNKDEGAYLGYVGKASDGMVDVQIISDLHKSEVYAIANLLRVHPDTIDVVPSGNMFDGRSDVQVFGASYDFVELYLTYLTYGKKKKDQFYQSLNPNSKKQFNIFSKNLENLHTYNYHKYLSRSPAVHLDLFPNKVPGEWGIPSKFLIKVMKKLTRGLC